MKKKFYAIISVLFVIGIVAVFVSSMNIDAHNNVSPDAYCYESIEIESNDTLWSIAEPYAKACGMSTASYVKEIQSMNNITGGSLKPGAHIIVFTYE